RHRKAIADITLDLSYEPLICIRMEKVGRKRILVFEDNGIGMNREIVENYFMKVGSSYYKSKEFDKEYHQLHKRGKGFKPLSQFGIGILSCFLIADKLKVNSYRLSPFDKDEKPLELELNGLTQVFILRDSQRSDFGTTISLELKDDVDLDLFKRLEEFARHIDIPIRITDVETFIIHNKPFKLDPGYKAKLPDNLQEKLVEVKIPLDGYHLGINGILELVLPIDDEGRPSFWTNTLTTTGYPTVGNYLTREKVGNILNQIPQIAKHYINSELGRPLSHEVDICFPVLFNIIERLNNIEEGDNDPELVDALRKCHSVMIAHFSGAILFSFEYLCFDGILMFSNKRYFYNFERFEYEASSFQCFEANLPKYLDLNISNDAKPRLNVARNGILKEDEREFQVLIDSIVCRAIFESINKGKISDSIRSKMAYLNYIPVDVFNILCNEKAFVKNYLFLEKMRAGSIDFVHFENLLPEEVFYLSEDDTCYCAHTHIDDHFYTDNANLATLVFINAGKVIYEPSNRLYRIEGKRGSNNTTLIYPTNSTIIFGHYEVKSDTAFFILNRRNVFNVNHPISESYLAYCDLELDDKILSELFLDLFKSLKTEGRYDYDYSISLSKAKDCLRRIKSRVNFLEILDGFDIQNLQLDEHSLVVFNSIYYRT
ncbi:MAG: hypothetical protein AAFY76_03840, partial [Cyanobacteria bacterium J06649_11]